MYLLFKEAIKKVKQTFGRFLSVLLIVALGVGFFIGLKGTCHDMLYTADEYYDKTNLMDFRIISTYGFTESDITSLKDLTNSLEVVPSYFVDVLSESKAIRIHTLSDIVNIPELVNGKYPENINECLGDSLYYQVGDKIKFNSNENLNFQEFTVTGTINSPMYVGGTRGITNIGNGKLESFIYVIEESFNMEVYNEIYLTTKNALNKDSYYNNYKETVLNLRNELEQIQPLLETRRYEEVKEEIEKEIIKAESKLNKEKNINQKKLNSALNELVETKNTLDSNQNLLNERIKEFNELISTTETKIKEGKISIATGWKQYSLEYNDYLLTYDEVADKIANSKLDIIKLKNQAKSIKEQADDIRTSNPSMALELEKQYTELMASIQDSEEKLNKEEETFLNAPDAFLKTKKNLEDEEKKLNKQETEFNQIKIETLETFKTSQEELTKFYSKYEDGYQKYLDSKEELLIKIKEAELEIDKVKEKLKTLEKPEWYLLDRTDNVGYTDYEGDANRVNSIATVFPLFFLLVAALVCLNTMARMIDEERTQIGVLKSLGYSNLVIVMNYVIYVFIATLLGCGIGLSLGSIILPNTIYNIYAFMYNFPSLKIDIDVLQAIVTSLAMFAVILIVTLSSCYTSLKEHPAALLRPKPPKKGKNIFLEKMDFLWSKFNFSMKVTVRNLFRYKKRVFMTVIGIAGCTALTLTGFGLRDSIVGIVKHQFDDLVTYEAISILDGNVKTLSQENISLLNENDITNPVLINQQLFSFEANNKKHDVYIMVPERDTEFYSYIKLKNYKTHKNVSLKDDGVVVTEKMANLLNVKESDVLKIRDSNNNLYIFKINDIVENYVYNYVYMNNTYYEKMFEKDVEYNVVLSNYDGEDKNLTSETLLKSNFVSNVTYMSDNIVTFNDMVDNLNSIVLVVLLASCLLGFVVLYNLTTINITERQREIATLKVLGFDDKEVSNYVYKEILILTFFGICLGLFLGVFLHRFVMQTAEMDIIMFQMEINFPSYIYTAILTFVFALIIEVVSYFKLMKINMIDSLKSVE